jgi:hypothetical protein
MSLGYWLENRGNGVRFPEEGSLLFFNDQTDFGDHPISYPIDAGGAFLGCTAAGE